jgi:hypothetical protein
MIYGVSLAAEVMTASVASFLAPLAWSPPIISTRPASISPPNRPILAVGDMTSPGRPAKKASKALRAQNARAVRLSVASPVLHPMPPPAAATRRPKRPRSNSDSGIHMSHTCKRYKAEHETVRRRDRLVKGLQDCIQQLQSELQELANQLASSAADNTGLTARIQALSDGFEALDTRQFRLQDKHAAAQSALQLATMRADRLERDLSASQQQCKDLKARVKDLDGIKRMYEARGRRAGKTPHPSSPNLIFKLRTGPKAKGNLPVDVRLAILELVTIGVGVDHVFRALLCCATLFKISLAGSFSPAMVQKAVLEAGVAGEIQLASTMDACSSATISCNSTSHKTITYLSKHLTFMMPSAPTEPVILSLPITTMQSHSSQAQLDDIIASFKSFYTTYLQSLGKIDVFYWRAFARKLLGGETDHAPDQKLMIKLMTQWKRLVDRELRGEQLLLAQKTPAELMKLLTERTRAQTGLEPLDWEKLPESDKMRHVSDAWQSICVPHGEEAFQQLSENEKRKIDLFIWAGCCMHKALNAAKNGYAEMSRTWSTIEGCPGPARLVSKDKRDAMNKTTSDKDRMSIYTTATGGAVPHNERCGMCFHSGDDKKGEQDVYKHEFEVRALTHVHISTYATPAQAWLPPFVP